MLLKSSRHYRAQKAQAVRFGNVDAAAKADLGLRAARIAKAIEVGCAEAPPLPPEILAALRDLLPPAGGEGVAA